MARMPLLIGLVTLGTIAGQYPPDSIPSPGSLPLGSKTPYWMFETPPPVNPSAGDLKCTIAYMAQVGRHGSRFGSNEPMNDLETTLREKGAAIGNTSLSFLKSWTNPFSPLTQKQLNIYGEDEWSAIGTRLQELYNSTILNATFNPDLHPVRTTYVSRTSRSASSFFTRALQSGGQLGPCRIEPVSMYSVFSGDTTKDGDRALRFFSNCPAFQAAVLNNASHPCNAEPEAYLSGNITRVMIPRVAASLQLDAARWNLTAGDLSNFWQTCQMESAALRLPLARSVCAVFGEPDYAMWNFYEDLNKYYARGPGDVRSHEIACPLANEVLGTLFDKTRPGAEIPARASFFFAHAETVLPLLAFFGLYSTGPPLTHDMPPSAMGSRVFRSSRLSTMAVNLRFVLHNCTSTTNPAASPQYKVELLHSERQIRWPRCGGNETDVVFCSPSDLLTAYPLAASCPFDNLCTKSAA